MSIAILGIFLNSWGGIRGAMFNSVEYVREICKQRNIPISTLELDCGFANGYLNPKKLKKIPYDRAVKIAKYLNISAEFLMTGEETKKSPSETGEGGVTDRQVKAAFFHGTDMTEEEMDAAWDDVMDLRELVLKRREREKGSK